MATARQDQQPAGGSQPVGARLLGKAIHHRVARRQGWHAMAPEAPGGQAVSHGHQPAAAAGHQGPFPGIPFTAFGPVITIGDWGSVPAAWPFRGPGEITFWGAHKAEAAAAAPGHQKRQEIAHGQDRIPPFAPAPHLLPLAPTQQGHARSQVGQEAPQALVAEAATGKPLPRADSAQQALGFGRGIAVALAHQGQHGNGEGWPALL